MKRVRTLLLLVLIVSGITNLNAQKEKYIDPENTASNRNGSISNPWANFDEVYWEENTTYYLKRDTRLNIDKRIAPQAANVTLDAYGDGKKPVIHATAKFKMIESIKGNLTVKNLEMKSDDRTAICAISHWYNGSLKVDNCEFHGMEWGIRIFNTDTRNYITNTTIYNTWDDGIYTENTNGITVEGCHIYESNMGYFEGPETVAGGDNIQISNDQGYSIIRNNILDRSASGNKFCLIIGEGITKEGGGNRQDSALVENNTFIGSNFDLYPDYNATSGIYVKSSMRSLIVRGNTFRGFVSGYSVITYAGFPVYFQNNVFETEATAIVLPSDATAYIANNVFSNGSTDPTINVGAATAEVKNNRFYVTEGTDHVLYVYSNGTLMESNNEYIYGTYTGGKISVDESFSPAVYPNPARSGEIIQLDSQDETVSSVELITPAGQIRGMEVNSSGSFYLPADIAPGVYFLRILSDKRSEFKTRIVVFR